jgi:hypothetical protein
MDLITGMAPDRGHGDGPLQDPDDFDVPTRPGADPLISADDETKTPPKPQDPPPPEEPKPEKPKPTDDKTTRRKLTPEQRERRNSLSNKASKAARSVLGKVWKEVVETFGAEDYGEEDEGNAGVGVRGQPNPEAGGAPPRTQEEMDAAMAEIRRKAEGIGGNMRDPADKTPIDPDAVVGSEVGPRGQPAGDEGGGPSPIHVGGLGMQPDAGTLKPDNPLDPDNPDLKRERKPGGTPHGGEGGGPAPTGDDEPS